MGPDPLKLPYPRRVSTLRDDGVVGQPAAPRDGRTAAEPSDAAPQGKVELVAGDVPPTTGTTTARPTSPAAGLTSASVPGAVPAAVPTTAPAPAETTAGLFEAAVRLHSRRLLAIARAIVGNRASAEDVVQQALVNLYQHRDRYDWREPGGLMRRSVVNEALRLLRQPRMTAVADDHPDDRGRRGTFGGPESGAGRFASPADPMIGRETVQRVRAAIDRLPEHFRAALVLCEYENMAYTQIAEVLGCSVPQVKTWLHRGRRQLAEMLREFVEGEPGPQHPPRPREPRAKRPAPGAAADGPKNVAPVPEEG